MWPETLSSMLSSRVTRPFEVIHTYTETTYPTWMGKIRPKMSIVQKVVARGTLYTGHKMKSITILHKFEEELIRFITDEEIQDIGREVKSQFAPHVTGTFRTWFL